jgi:hypothetical protein
MAWRNHKEGVPLITPVYYTNPEDDGAYSSVAQEYWFGSELLAAPFVSAHDADTDLARQRVWLPAGDWYNFFTGEYIQGNKWQITYGDLDTIPVYARAGAIVPLDPDPGWGVVNNPAALTVHGFIGASNHFELYEDDGETTSYRAGKYALTAYSHNWSEKQASFTIERVVGDISLIPAQREYKIVLHGMVNPERVEISLNGDPYKAEFTYDSNGEMLSFASIVLTPTDSLSIVISTHGDTLLSKRDRRAEALDHMLRSFKLDTWTKAAIARDLPAILSGEKLLIEYYGLKDSQISALTHLLSL